MEGWMRVVEEKGTLPSRGGAVPALLLAETLSLRSVPRGWGERWEPSAESRRLCREERSASCPAVPVLDPAGRSRRCQQAPTRAYGHRRRAEAPGEAAKQTPGVPGQRSVGLLSSAYLELVLICNSLIACNDLGLSLLRSRVPLENIINAIGLKSPAGEARSQRPARGRGSAAERVLPAAGGDRAHAGGVQVPPKSPLRRT